MSLTAFQGRPRLEGVSRPLATLLALGAIVETALLGVAGIATLNVLRITAVALVAFAFARLPAIIVHGYGCLLATVIFLMAFRACAYNVVLERVETEEDDA